MEMDPVAVIPEYPCVMSRTLAATFGGRQSETFKGGIHVMLSIFYTCDGGYRGR